MVELELITVSETKDSPVPVVLLRHDDQILPILVGLAEAQAIHLGMTHQKPARPMTHDLICNLLAGLRAHVKSVTIYKLENDTFFAFLTVEQHGADGRVEQVLRIDTRPSDGIAIATRVACPIYAAEEVMAMAAQNASIVTPEEPEPEEDDPGDVEPDTGSEDGDSFGA